MGKCKNRMVRFGRWAARILGMVVGPYVPQVVQGVEAMSQVLSEQLPDIAFGGHEKRALAIAMLKAKAKEVGHDIYDESKPVSEAQFESAARAAIESAVFNMNAKIEGWADDLADWAASDLEDDDGPTVKPG